MYADFEAFMGDKPTILSYIAWIHIKGKEFTLIMGDKPAIISYIAWSSFSPT